MSSSITPEENNQPIHLEWKGKVHLKHKELSEESKHIEAFKVRHEYTNYDQLINSIELQRLEALERSRTVAIIKYECTSQALQFRNGIIREQCLEAKKQSAKLAKDLKTHKGLIGAIQKILWGNEKKIRSLNAIIDEKVLEITSLKDGIEEEKVANDYTEEIATWKKRFEEEEKRRQELGKNNQRLGGRLSHAERNKEKLDLVSNMLDESEILNIQHSKDLETVKRELTEHKVLKRKYEQKISGLEKEIRNLELKGLQDG